MDAGIEYSARHEERERKEFAFRIDKKRQAGIAFPDAKIQQHALIVRLDLSPNISLQVARSGLQSLCSIFERIYTETQKMDELRDEGDTFPSPLSKFFFTATIGFGAPFFDKLRIPRRPRNLYTMPDHTGLGDQIPYVFDQTDIIIQLASNSDFVNRWVYEYAHDVPRPLVDYISNTKQSYAGSTELQNEPLDILSSIKDWAHVRDLHIGLQRLDGRNLMGFNDGLSNPDRLELEDIIWTDEHDEDKEFTNGTYMVFQKIEHDLVAWRSLSVHEQEELVGRSKGTGLLLGTLPREEDINLAIGLHGENLAERENARLKLKEIIHVQRDPKAKIFDHNNSEFKNIQDSCPAWSHVRKANPRQADGSPSKVIFRRGYLFSEIGSSSGFRSGLLFICFQKDVSNGFEYIKKNWLNNKDFPVPQSRAGFTDNESIKRHLKARFTVEEIRALSSEQRQALGWYGHSYESAIEEAEDKNAQNTGKDGLSGPSKLGIYPVSHLSATITLGGGYYFVPSIPSQDLSLIGQPFFE